MLSTARRDDAGACLIVGWPCLQSPTCRIRPNHFNDDERLVNHHLLSSDVHLPFHFVFRVPLFCARYLFCVLEEISLQFRRLTRGHSFVRNNKNFILILCIFFFFLFCFEYSLVVHCRNNKPMILWKYSSDWCFSSSKNCWQCSKIDVDDTTRRFVIWCSSWKVSKISIPYFSYEESKATHRVIKFSFCVKIIVTEA